tara:strand:- start:121944 stop:122363 length:420 start_codon:yes stop_codon:yes gene_type:complete
MKSIQKFFFIFFVLGQTQYLAAEEILTGDDIAKALVGNTLQMVFRDADVNFRTQQFHEYYALDGRIEGMQRIREQSGSFKHYIGSWKIKDGKFCTSVYGRNYSCDTLKRINEDTFQIVGENGDFRDVKIYEGKHHGLSD